MMAILLPIVLGTMAVAAMFVAFKIPAKRKSGSLRKRKAMNGHQAGHGVWTEPRDLTPDEITTSIRQFTFREPDVAAWRAAIERYAAEEGFDPALIAAIISIETGGKNVIGDGGHGHGLMQIDDRSYPEWTRQWVKNGKDPFDAIKKGVDVLAEKREYLLTRMPAEIPVEDIQVAAVAAYNRGQSRVLRSARAGRDVDEGTTGGKYSRKVYHHAKLFGEKWYGR